MPPAIELIDINKSFGEVRANKDVNLTVLPGTIHGIVGSIHKIGALVQGLPACNGWTFWHAERQGGRVELDEFRAAIRQQGA